MASNMIVHSKMGIVDATGNISQFCPKTSGMDVIISGNQYGSGNTIQEVNDNLSKLAFDQTFMGIDDDTSSSEVKTYSAKKLSALLTALKNEGTSLDTAFQQGGAVLGAEISRYYSIQVSSTSNPNAIASAIDELANAAFIDGYNTAKGEQPEPEPEPEPEPVVPEELIHTLHVDKHIVLTGGVDEITDTIEDSIDVDTGNVNSILGYYINGFNGNIMYKSFPAEEDVSIGSKSRLNVAVGFFNSVIDITYSVNTENIISGSTLDISLDIVYT